ncbi:MAG: DegT/DnrJ/EryC1/StrS family aminotransferase [Saccharofermentanales bacterium]|jgi:UDP-2-acetamido-2-deoxy-ribo-hexuluronate aminotransferase
MEFRDLKQQYQILKKDIDQAVLDVMESAAFIGGDPVTKLEQELAAYVGVKHCVSCANGTDAMSLVLAAWDIGPGDAVFVPDFTFFATAEVVAYCGATPIFVDVLKETFNIDTADLIQAIEEVIAEGELKPRAIIPVDLFGLPADYPELEKIARKYNLLILSDSAQGFGGSIDGKKAGSFGDAATTSFFPAKPLGCYGDGGAIFTNDSDLAELLNSLKVHGKGSYKYDNVRIGVNSRLDTIQAAILRVKLKAFQEYELAEVNRIADLYRQALDNEFRTPQIPESYESSYAQFTLILNSSTERDFIRNKLKVKDIPTMVYYPIPLHRQTAFSDLQLPQRVLRNTGELCQTVLSLPMHPYLSDADLTLISETLIESKRSFAVK